MTEADALVLARLLQLVSPALPVGAYSYSQGLETAVNDGLVNDAVTATSWVRDILHFSMCSFEAPLLWRMSVALESGDQAGFGRWNAIFRAGRETAELRAETLQMGHALIVLVKDLPLGSARDLERLQSAGPLTFPAVFSFAAMLMGVERHAALIGYVWSWLENQVMAALKTVPLGQTAGQRMLATMGAELPDLTGMATKLTDDELSNFAPGLAIVSSRHETQYSRLFRS